MHGSTLSLFWLFLISSFFFSEIWHFIQILHFFLTYNTAYLKMETLQLSSDFSSSSFSENRKTFSCNRSSFLRCYFLPLYLWIFLYIIYIMYLVSFLCRQRPSHSDRSNQTMEDGVQRVRQVNRHGGKRRCDVNVPVEAPSITSCANTA